MFFSGKKSAFGRHETFQLRYSWLTKGFQELQNDPNIFTSTNATLKLGVGKNMVNSIRYWMLATQIIESTSKGYEPTELGNSIFSDNGFDKYLEDEATIWLIHWLLTTNPNIATSWYWFFNVFNKPEFTKTETKNALQDFIDQNIDSNVASNTINKDIDVLLRMYSHKTSSDSVLSEELLDSPLSLLKLITQSSDNKSYYSSQEDRNNIPLGVIGFALTSIFASTETNIISIENLMYMKAKHSALGTVFRMNECQLLAKLEDLTHYIPEIYSMSDSAGEHQIYQNKAIQPIEYLKKHYQTSNIKVAA